MVVMTGTVSVLFIVVMIFCVTSIDTSSTSNSESISNTVNEAEEPTIVEGVEQPSSSSSNRQVVFVAPSDRILSREWHKRNKVDNPLRTFLSRGGRLPNSAIVNVREALLSGNLERFTPPPITDPNCYVEIQVVQRVPGRCIRIANGLPACQTEHWLSLNTDECS